MTVIALGTYYMGHRHVTLIIKSKIENEIRRFPSMTALLVVVDRLPPSLCFYCLMSQRRVFLSGRVRAKKEVPDDCVTRFGEISPLSQIFTKFLAIS